MKAEHNEAALQEKKERSQDARACELQKQVLFYKKQVEDLQLKLKLDADRRQA